MLSAAGCGDTELKTGHCMLQPGNVSPLPTAALAYVLQQRCHQAALALPPECRAIYGAMYDGLQAFTQWMHSTVGHASLQPYKNSALETKRWKCEWIVERCCMDSDEVQPCTAQNAVLCPRVTGGNNQAGCLGEQLPRRMQECEIPSCYPAAQFPLACWTCGLAVLGHSLRPGSGQPGRSFGCLRCTEM